MLWSAKKGRENFSVERSSFKVRTLCASRWSKKIVLVAPETIFGPPFQFILQSTKSRNVPHLFKADTRPRGRLKNLFVAGAELSFFMLIAFNDSRN